MFFHQSSVRRVLPLKEAKKKNKNERASSVVCLALHTTYSACVHTKFSCAILFEACSLCLQHFGIQTFVPSKD